MSSLSKFRKKSRPIAPRQCVRPCAVCFVSGRLPRAGRESRMEPQDAVAKRGCWRPMRRRAQSRTDGVSEVTMKARIGLALGPLGSSS
jgi:hypothetical protein